MDAGNKVIFDNLKRAADVLVDTLGKHCEVAVHDFTDLEHSLIYIAGSVTGRKPGAPVTDLVVKAWRREGEGVRDIPSYKTITKDGRTLKSSTTFVRDRKGKVIGAFCVNFDVTEFLNAISIIQEFSHIANSAGEEKETFAHSVNETIDSLIKQAIAKVGKQPATMQTEDKIKLVSILEEKGTFLIKGSVDYVAAIMGVSKFTIYNYLQKIRNTEKINIM